MPLEASREALERERGGGVDMSTFHFSFSLKIKIGGFKKLHFKGEPLRKAGSLYVYCTHTDTQTDILLLYFDTRTIF